MKWWLLIFILVSLRMSLCAQDTVRVYDASSDTFYQAPITGYMAYDRHTQSWYACSNISDNRPVALVITKDGAVTTIGSAVYSFVSVYYRRRGATIERWKASR